jgi:Tol biopolymer transport system component
LGVLNSQLNDTVPDISADGETLFFTPDRAGSFGRSDLYMTTRSKRGG